MTVSLPATAKGTHMSRFIEVLESQPGVLDQPGFHALLNSMLSRLGASGGTIEMAFPYFIEKTAPVSRVRSQLDYDVFWRGSILEDGTYRFWKGVTAPVTRLCPGSNEISAYGSHTQPWLKTIAAELT